MDKIDNKKIPTVLGTVIIVIIAITVGALVWKYEEIKNRGEAQMQNTITQIKPIEKNQTQEENKKEESIDTSDWKNYSDSRIIFSYPNSCDLRTASDNISNKNPNMYFFNQCFDQKNAFQILLYSGLANNYVEKRLNLPNTVKVNELKIPSGEEILILNIQSGTTNDSRFLSFVSRKNSNISLEVYGPSTSASLEDITSYNLFVRSMRIK